MNFYEMNLNFYNKLIMENVIKIYKKVSDEFVGRLDVQFVRIVECFNLDDCIEKLVKKEVFIILKDYKLIFSDYLMCCLINLIKFEIGVISKQILDEINIFIIDSM